MRIPRVSSFSALILLPVFLLMSRQASALDAYGLVGDNRVLVFDTATPGEAGRMFLQGLPEHTVILAITVRWADQQLYGLGSDQRLYRINRNSGQTAAVSATPFAIPLQGFAFGMDIDPITDQVRVISNTGQHVRIDPTTGAVIDGDPATPGTQPDTPLPPGIGAIASAASFAGTPSTTLFGIDFLNTRFVRIGGPNGAPSPNAGGVTPLGPLHQQTGPMIGIDITPHGHELFAVLTNGLTSTLFHAARVDVPWAAAGIIGDGDEPVRSLAVFSVATTLWAVRGDVEQHLVSFSSANPSVLTSDVVITGLDAPDDLIDTIVAMQFGRSSGKLFAVTKGRIYTIDPATGVAQISEGSGFLEMSGTVFSVEKSQADVEMDLITDTGERRRIDLITGLASALPPIASGTQIVGASIGPGPGGLALFGIDQAARRLVIIDETGGVSPRGGLGFAFDASGGFDVAFADFSAFAALRDTADSAFKLVTIDLATGAALPVGTIGDGAALRALAAAPQGEISIAITPNSVSEASGAASVILTRSGALTPTMVDVLVEEDFAAGLRKIPTLGVDVAPVRTTVVFPAGEDAITVQIPIVNDTLAEEDEVFKVFVNNPTNRVSLPGDGFVRVFIDDDDEGNPLPIVVIEDPTEEETLITAATQFAIGGRAVDDEPVVSVTVASDRGFSATAALSDKGEWVVSNVTLQPGVNVITATVTDELGATATDVLTIERVSKEPGLFNEIQYLFAEGATGGFFSTDILLLNPQSVEAPVSIEYLTPSGVAQTQTLTLPPKSHRTIQVDSIPGLEAQEVSTVVTSLDGRELGVERTMRWSSTNYAAHTERATFGAARTWFFAEGSQGFFFTYLLLANPQETANTATVRFLVEGGSPVTKIFTLAPKSRMTVGADSIPELLNQSFGMEVTFERPGVAERAMYFGLDPLFNGGHESIGAPELSSTWVLAEGATGTFFKTFVLLANPNPVPAEVAVTYFRPSGDPIRKFKTVPANGRLTINLELEDPALAAADVSTQVLSTVPIIAERSQYWPFTPDQWQGTHNSFGLPFFDVTWALAEGRVGGPDQFQTFVLLANPLATPTEITLTFVRENGAPITHALTLAPLSRLTVTTGPGSLVPELQDESFGVIVESSQPIAVERSMYSSAGGRIFSAGTNATGTPVFIDDGKSEGVVASQMARRTSASRRAGAPKYIARSATPGLVKVTTIPND